MKDNCPCKNCITVAICRHKPYSDMLNDCLLIYNYLYIVDSGGMSIRERFNFKKKIKHPFIHLRPSLWEIRDRRPENTREYADHMVRTLKTQFRKLTGVSMV